MNNERLPGKVIIDMQNKGVELMTERDKWRNKNDFRCSKCKKLLAKIQPMISKDGTNYLTFHENGKVNDISPKIEIICPRCKTMNTNKESVEVEKLG